MENYTIINFIEEGGYGKVYKAKNKNDEIFAIKKIPIDSRFLILEKNSEYLYFKSEINKVHNENLIKYYDVFIEKNYLYVVMEFFEGIDLVDFVIENENEGIQEDLIKDLMIQIIKGLKILHDNNFYHRDIKLENIMLSKNKKIKIIDFGLCSNKNEYYYEKTGTLQYLSPQIFYIYNYNKEDLHEVLISNDIWALGIILFCFNNLHLPFCTDKDAKKQIMELKIVSNYKKRDKSNNSKNIHWLDSLVYKILERDYKKRISINEIESIINNN